MQENDVVEELEVNMTVLSDHVELVRQLPLNCEIRLNN
jgi:hypothetical protein